MGKGSPSREAVIDTSVLVNFLRVQRIDLLGQHSSFRFLVPDLVEGEITPKYPSQMKDLGTAFVNGELFRYPMTDPNELVLYQKLVQGGRLGVGECATIAVASARGILAAIEERPAIRVAASLTPQVICVKTQDIVLAAIRAGTLTISDADKLLTDWGKDHRFTLPFRSFAEILQP